MSNQLYFAIDSCGDMNTFEHLHEAKEWAERCLEDERIDAAEGWSEDVHTIKYGRLIGGVVETMRRARTDDDVFISPDCD